MSIETEPSQGYRDIYGRYLAYIWLPDGRNFGEVMIGDGYAHEYTYRYPYVYQDEFRTAQAEAMANQLGLWSPATCTATRHSRPTTARAAHKQAGQRRQHQWLLCRYPHCRPAQASTRPSTLARATATTARTSRLRLLHRPCCGLTRVTRTASIPIGTGLPVKAIRLRATW